MSSKCSSCSAPIVWANTATGKKMPLDAQPHPLGNLVMDEAGNVGPPDAWPGNLGTPDLTKRYRSHFATCPQADRHRKK